MSNAFPVTQYVTFAIGLFVPLITYVINHHAPWVSEKVKGVVLAVAAAIAGGLYQAIEVGHLGFNGTTLEYVLAAVIAAFGAHHWLWKPSTISTDLGAGSNAK